MVYSDNTWYFARVPLIKNHFALYCYFDQGALRCWFPLPTGKPGAAQKTSSSEKNSTLNITLTKTWVINVKPQLYIRYFYSLNWFWFLNFFVEKLSCNNIDILRQRPTLPHSIWCCSRLGEPDAHNPKINITWPTPGYSPDRQWCSNIRGFSNATVELCVSD